MCFRFVIFAVIRTQFLPPSQSIWSTSNTRTSIKSSGGFSGSDRSLATLISGASSSNTSRSSSSGGSSFQWVFWNWNIINYIVSKFKWNMSQKYFLWEMAEREMLRTENPDYLLSDWEPAKLLSKLNNFNIVKNCYNLKKIFPTELLHWINK